MPKVVYKCSYCGTVYDTKMDARWCEILHSRRSQEEKDRQYRDELLEAKKDPCDYCARAYFVYGCERACEDADCRNYEHFLMKMKT